MDTAETSSLPPQRVMPDRFPVYASRSTRAKHLIAVLSFIALPIGLGLYGWFFQDAAATLLLVAFGVIVAGGTLIFIRKYRILRFDSAPILIIQPQGIEIRDKTLPWTAIGDAIIFTYEGERVIGFRLRKDLSLRERSELSLKFGNSLDWQRFGMPVVLSFSDISLSDEEVLAQLRAHDVKLSVGEKPIAFGHESDLL